MRVCEGEREIQRQIERQGRTGREGERERGREGERERGIGRGRVMERERERKVKKGPASVARLQSDVTHNS